MLFGDGVELPCRPFPGTIGVAPDSPGPHSVLPPSRFGGNIDIRHLTAGARLLLPVGVEGALFSAGDGHAAQGDGEVCGSAIETGMEIALRLVVRRDLRIDAPQLSRPGRAGPTEPWRGLCDDGRRGGSARGRAGGRAGDDRAPFRPLRPLAEEAYAVPSVAGDLRIHEIVNAPRWVVGAALPDAVLA